jgi:carboxylesterase
VLLHGYTASPAQFTAVAQGLFAAGWNVIVPRLPLHGYEDRMTDRIAALDIPSLTSCAVDALTSARELGRRVTVGGFSLGGLLATWLANRNSVDRIIAMAPCYGLLLVPSSFTGIAARVLLAQPNHFWWWNPIQRERLGPDHGYPRYASRPLAHMLRLAQSLTSELRTTPPRTADFTLVLNAHETAVNNRAARQIANLWARHPETSVVEHLITDLPPSHDIVEPLRDTALARRALPALLQAFTNESREDQVSYENLHVRVEKISPNARGYRI